jgi:hypothetical protein
VENIKDKQDLIRDIIELELEMFLNVQAREKASCQENPDGFRFYRGATFSVWSKEALASYREDLITAKSEGRNLLTLKYARMENLIPVLNDNELIDKIVDITIGWLKEMARKYPNIQSRGRSIEEDGSNSTSTKTYLRCELETYSSKTLEHYYHNLQDFLGRGENLSEKICLAMVSGSGFGSLQEAEDSLSPKSTVK